MASKAEILAGTALVGLAVTGVGDVNAASADQNRALANTGDKNTLTLKNNPASNPIFVQQDGPKPTPTGEIGLTQVANAAVSAEFSVESATQYYLVSSSVDGASANLNSKVVDAITEFKENFILSNVNRVKLDDGTDVPWGLVASLNTSKDGKPESERMIVSAIPLAIVVDGIKVYKIFAIPSQATNEIVYIITGNPDRAGGDVEGISSYPLVDGTFPSQYVRGRVDRAAAPSVYGKPTPLLKPEQIEDDFNGCKNRQVLVIMQEPNGSFGSLGSAMTNVAAGNSLAAAGQSAMTSEFFDYKGILK